MPFVWGGPEMSIEYTVLPALDEIMDSESGRLRGPIAVHYGVHRQKAHRGLERGVVFLDREGVINENNRSCGDDAYYSITSPNLFIFRPGAKKAIRSLTRAGWPIIIISNQEAVEKGQMTVEDLVTVSNKMYLGIRKAGGDILAAYYCPHDPEIPCDCRKPSPNMLFDAAEEYRVYLSESWFVGDNPTDIVAGNAARVTTIHIPLEFCPKEDKRASGADFMGIRDLTTAATIILGMKRVGSIPGGIKLRKPLETDRWKAIDDGNERGNK